MAATDKYTQTTESCGGKGTAWLLSQEENSLTLALTGFYCFSGHITLRMVLFTMHRFAVTENKGEGVTEYIKEGYLQCKGEMVTPVVLHTWKV